MRMDEYEFKRKKYEILDGKMQRPINSIYQWVKENKISPAQMSELVLAANQINK